MSLVPWNEAPIRAAHRDESEVVLDLLREVFGTTLLPYTIYQAPASVRYLEGLIRQQSEDAPRILVVASDHNIAAFYDGVRHGDVHFLNYIGVAAAIQGSGLGDRLLEHFEIEGKRRGAASLGLDVFKSNERAWRWYERRGYKQEKVSFVTRVSLAAVRPRDAATLVCGASEVKRAFHDELTQGFGKFDCECGSGRITVGLIAGRLCKLLDLRDVTIEEAIPAIAAHLSAARDVLLVPSNTRLEPRWPTEGVEEVARLVKVIGSAI